MSPQGARQLSFPHLHTTPVLLALLLALQTSAMYLKPFLYQKILALLLSAPHPHHSLFCLLKYLPKLDFLQKVLRIRKEWELSMA